MANRDVENQAEGSVAGHHKSAISMALCTLTEGMRDEHGKFLPMWSRIFVMSCVLAVSIDPLFFYILMIDEDNKCLQMDKKLSTTVVMLRLLTDIIFVVPFIYKIMTSMEDANRERKAREDDMRKRKARKRKAREDAMRKRKAREDAMRDDRLHTHLSPDTRTILYRNSKRRVLIGVGKKIALNMSWLSFSIINDFLALLPVPQLLIVVTIYNMRGAEYVKHRKVLNVFILGQYLPRIYRIHQSFKELQETAGIWVKALCNFVLYILASQILGAFWYFFSIQQETLCWHNACAKHSSDPIGCMSTFYCERQTTTSRNIIFLNKYCLLDTPDDVLPPFNFGIFLDSLKNHNIDNIKFEKKFFYSFWWGLRNLSNFGTNLTTSTYVWENLFAILISVVGLLLFLYLIGNVQMEATKKEEMRQTMEGGEIYRKIRYVRIWMQENKFPDDIKKDISNTVDKALKKDKDADVHNTFLILPWHTKRSVKRHLFMDTLKTVKMLKEMDEKVLTWICDNLMPVTYIKNSFVFRMGDPLDCMMFIIDGTMWTYESSDSQVGKGISSLAIKCLGKGHFYGEELLDWTSDCFTELPVSTKHVKSQTKVEAFVLMARDLETLVSRCPLQWENRKKGGSQKVMGMAASTIATAFRRHREQSKPYI